MSKKIENMVEELALPIVSELGYELVGVEYNVRKGADGELIVFIDKEGGVTLDDCELASRALDAPLDELDPIAESYVLVVSSPGLDRPLKTGKDFQRALGKDVEIKLYQKRNGEKELLGRLAAFDAQTVEIVRTAGTERLNRAEIAQIRLHIDF